MYNIQDDIKYNKIKYENKTDLSKLKKDTYHYFKDKEEIISEKKILSKKFTKRTWLIIVK